MKRNKSAYLPFSSLSNVARPSSHTLNALVRFYALHNCTKKDLEVGTLARMVAVRLQLRLHSFKIDVHLSPYECQMDVS